MSEVGGCVESKPMIAEVDRKEDAATKKQWIKDVLSHQRAFIARCPVWDSVNRHPGLGAERGPPRTITLHSSCSPSITSTR
jgi:hypothetical protein